MAGDLGLSYHVPSCSFFVHANVQGSKLSPEGVGVISQGVMPLACPGANPEANPEASLQVDNKAFYTQLIGEGIQKYVRLKHIYLGAC